MSSLYLKFRAPKALAQDSNKFLKIFPRDHLLCTIAPMRSLNTDKQQCARKAQPTARRCPLVTPSLSLERMDTVSGRLMHVPLLRTWLTRCQQFGLTVVALMVLRLDRAQDHFLAMTLCFGEGFGRLWCWPMHHCHVFLVFKWHRLPWWRGDKAWNNIILTSCCRPFSAGRHKRNGSYGEVPSNQSAPSSTTHVASGGSSSQAGQGGRPGAKGSKVNNNEKTLLLSSDDEFQ